MQMLQQQEERKERIERERVRDERERVREERREANERMWQYIMMASFAAFMPKNDNLDYRFKLENYLQFHLVMVINTYYEFG